MAGHHASMVAARACLLTADAVVDHDGGKGDATEVGQGVLVVAGRDSAPLFESVEPALDGVAVKWPCPRCVDTGYAAF